MKPFIHAESSVKKWGGEVSDYLKIHDWFDQTKAHFGDNRHRAILHSSFGIFLAESVFGHNITNSEGKQISVRDIGEQHVIEDMGCIPTVSDYLSEMSYQNWMHGKGCPPSNCRIAVPPSRPETTAWAGGEPFPPLETFGGSNLNSRRID